MIIPVDETNVLQAAAVHATAWRDSHRAFCTPEFIELHTTDRQRKYLCDKIDGGTKVFMLVDERPVGIVSITGGLIEDLYVLPEYQHRGYGTRLLDWAVSCCMEIPTLWILDNNDRARYLYEKYGFHETGNVHQLTENLSEIEFSLKTGE